MTVKNSESESESVKGRLRLFIKYKGIPVLTFEKKCGMGNGYVNGIRSSISPEKSKIIATAFPELNMGWVLTGEGEMLKKQAPPKTTHESHLATNGKHKGLIPLVDMEGLPAQQDEDYINYSIPEFHNRGVEYLIRVGTNSMHTHFSNGDLLACRRIDEIKFFQWGRTYVIGSSQGIFVRKVMPDPENKENISCVSYNDKDYPAFTMPISDISNLVIVLGSIRLE